MGNTILLDLHSWLRWVFVLMGLYLIYNSYVGWKKNKPYTAQDNTLSLMYIIICDLQLLLGFILYFTSPVGYQIIFNLGMKTTMSTPVYRFFAVEHLVGMLIAVILIHIGRIKAKKAIGGAAKHKAIFVWTLIGFIIAMVMIPWPFRAMFAGRGWF